MLMIKLKLYLFIVLLRKIPFMDACSIFQFSETYLNFVYNFRQLLKFLCEFHNSIESANAQCTLWGNPPERANQIFQIPQCFESKGFLKFIKLYHKWSFQLFVCAEEIIREGLSEVSA